MSQMPGLLLYFDSLRFGLSVLNNEQKGILFQALLDYAENGEYTEMDCATGLVFDYLKTSIDRNTVTYQKTCIKRRHASYNSHLEKANQKPFEDWLEDNPEIKTEWESLK